MARPATSPITTTAGFVTPAARTAPARSRSGAVTTRCCRLQPSDTTAPGVPPPSPAEISVSAISARWSIDISSTRVIPLRASAAQSTELRESPGRTCPASTQKPWLTPRCVTGMPAAAGTEMALVTPGTTSTGTPAVRHASTSSRPRPNTNGSPPFSRTTARPGAGVLDQRVVDVVLPHRRAAGHLGRVHHLHAGRQLLQQCQRREAVGHHHVGLAQPVQPGHRDQARVARPAADDRHPPGRRLPAAPARRFLRSTNDPPCPTVSTKRSRSSAARRGSRPALTATVTGPARPTAGTQAAEAAASSARAHHRRCRSASAATASLTSGWSVQASTSQAPSSVAWLVPAPMGG